MDGSKVKLEPDPDYKDISEVKKEKTGSTEEPIKNYEKLIQVIQREFQKDIDYKREEVHKIQKQLLKVQKTLHLLKYIVVKSFYENKDVKVATNTNEIPVLPSTSSNEAEFMSSENRIHPAVKKLIGKKPINYEPYRTRLKNNKSITKIGENVTIKEEADELKNDFKIHDEGTIFELVTHEKKTSTESNVPVRNRDKNKYRILVGNISKWMPSNSANDNSTHKWMMYVRGPKENPDISHIVKKVRFFLHPSYQPNDIVDVQEAPFHLSRRGWGEFPLRVQIHFKNWKNKPIDIIHNIKLDRTYSGRQTMGGETLVDVWLHDKDISDTETLPKKPRMDDISMYTKDDLYSDDYKTLFKKDLPDQPKIEKFTQSCPVFNCDNIANFIEVCSENIKELRSIEEENNVYEDRLCADLKSVNSMMQPEDIFFDDDEVSLLNNIGIKEIPECLFEDQTSCDTRDVDRVYLEDHCYTNLKESSSSVRENKIVKPKYVVGKSSMDPNYLIDKDRYKLEVPLEYLMTLPQIIYFMFKNLPLYTELAKEVSYTCLYPYAATSSEEFKSWNPMKQFCSEWYRAKHIKKFLTAKDLEGHQNWSTKSILLFGQAHGFSPIERFELFHKKPTESGKSLPNQFNSTFDTNTLTSIVPIKDLLDYKTSLKYASNDYCDIDGTDSKSVSSKPDNDNKFNDIPNELPCQFIRETVRKLDISLKPEEIIPGVYARATEQTILKSVMCLAEELIRKSVANNVIERKLKVSNMEISKEDVFNVLLEREEFSIFLNCGLGKNIMP